MVGPAAGEQGTAVSLDTLAHVQAAHDLTMPEGFENQRKFLGEFLGNLLGYFLGTEKVNEKVKKKKSN